MLTTHPRLTENILKTLISFIIEEDFFCYRFFYYRYYDFTIEEVTTREDNFAVKSGHNK